VGQRVVGDAGFGVGFDQRRVQVGFFAWAQCRHHGALLPPMHLGLGAAHHQAQQAVQGDQVGAQRVVGFFGVDDRGKSNGLMRVANFQAQAHIGAADGVAHALVFVFRVDNEYLGAEHHAAQRFQLDGETTYRHRTWQRPPSCRFPG
jgi:hypothetical protein